MKKIERTNNYKGFKRLKGNREVSPTRIRKIVESINKVGYITSPIIVNERMEVIDGQGRLEALEFLGMPVEYIVHKGAGIEECLSMNIHQTNWTIRDYIKSYADRGMQSYIYTQKLIEDFADISILAVIMATQETNKIQKKIYNGELLVSQRQYELARERLQYLRKCLNEMTYKNGSKSYLEYAILICTTIDEVDLDRLYEKLKERNSIMKNWNSTATCLQSIEDIYNEQLGYPIFIYTEYRKSLYKKYGNKANGRKDYIKAQENKLKVMKGEKGVD